MISPFHRLALLLPLAALAACSPDVADFGAVALRPGDGGVLLNTNHIGRHRFAELDLAGAQHQGVTLLSVTIEHGDVVLEKVWVEDGEIHGVADGFEYDGDNFLNSRWKVAVERDGGDISALLRITAITATEHTLVYDFEHVYEGGPKWPEPSCDPDPELDGSISAVVTGDIHVDPDSGAVSKRPDTLHIGCLSGGVGKAGFWGYPFHVVGMEAFEAAIRMVRADYCGTGQSFTEPGLAVSIKDIFAINEPALPALTEAIWGEKGARCVGTPRSDHLDLEHILAICADGGVNAPTKCEDEADLESEDGLYWTFDP